jgi:hypothetical protein
VLFNILFFVLAAVALQLYFRAEARYWKLRRDIAEALREGRETIGSKEAMRSTLIIPLHIWIMADKAFTRIQNIITPPKKDSVNEVQ